MAESDGVERHSARAHGEDPPRIQRRRIMHPYCINCRVGRAKRLCHGQQRRAPRRFQDDESGANQPDPGASTRPRSPTTRLHVDQPTLDFAIVN